MTNIEVFDASAQSDYKPPLETVELPSGEVKQIPIMQGEVLICKGCCCGDTENGNPEVPVDEYERQWLKRGLAKRIHITISGCLGICSVPNLVMIICMGKVITLHSIEGAEDVTAIYDYIESILDAGCYLPLPPELASRHLERFNFGHQD